MKCCNIYDFNVILSRRTGNAIKKYQLWWEWQISMPFPLNVNKGYCQFWVGARDYIGFVTTAEIVSLEIVVAHKRDWNCWIFLIQLKNFSKMLGLVVFMFDILRPIPHLRVEDNAANVVVMIISHLGNHFIVIQSERISPVHCQGNSVPLDKDSVHVGGNHCNGYPHCIGQPAMLPVPWLLDGLVKAPKWQFPFIVHDTIAFQVYDRMGGTELGYLFYISRQNIALQLL